MKKYVVKLTENQRKELQQVIAAGQAPARKLMHDRISLKADESEGCRWSCVVR
jgi:hypothetical protein